jgi:hypothetical protein
VITEGIAMSDNVRDWITANLINGYTTEQLHMLLSRAGFHVKEIEKELALTEPYIAALHQLKEDKDKIRNTLSRREALLKTLDKQMHNLSHYLTLERVPLPPFKRFLEEYYYLNRPGLFSEVLENCEARHWTPRRLAEKVGVDTLVEIQYGIVTGAYDQFKDEYKKQIKFSEFADMLEDPRTGSNFYMMAINYAPNNPTMKILQKDISDIGDGYLIPDRSPNCKMSFFIGPQGTVTALHYDLVNNLYIQVYGRKLIRLIPALQVPYMYNNAVTYSDVDPLEPDLVTYPHYARATVIEIEVGPGDGLFIPLGWGHHITSLSPSISLSCSNMNVPQGYEIGFIDRKEAYGY